MGLVPGFDHDVFVSYAHDDNRAPVGHGLTDGWVTTLVGNLLGMPGETHGLLGIVRASSRHARRGEVASTMTASPVSVRSLAVYASAR